MQAEKDFKINFKNKRSKSMLAIYFYVLFRSMAPVVWKIKVKISKLGHKWKR